MSVAINKDLSQPFRTKGITVSEARHNCLKSSVHVNMSLLEVDQKELYECINVSFEQK